MSAKYVMEMKSKYGIPNESIESEAWVASYLKQCSECKRWFESESFRSNHTCITPTAIAATGRDNRWLNNSNGTSVR